VSERAGGAAPRAATWLALLALASPAIHGRAPDASTCATPRFGKAQDGVPTAICVGAPGGRSQQETAGAARLLFGLRLDPRREDPRALEALPGIGPARAQAIAREARRQPFCRPEDLERVVGIGPVLRARLAAWVETSSGACAE